MSNSIELISFFNQCKIVYDNKINDILNTNPNSYFNNQSDIDSFFNIETRKLKQEYLPPISDQFISTLLNKFELVNLLSHQDDIFSTVKGAYFEQKMDEIFNRLVDHKKYKLFNAIKYTPRFFKNKIGYYLNDIDTLNIFNCLSSIKAPFNDNRFSTSLFWANFIGGWINEESNPLREEFLIRRYNFESKKYEIKQSPSLFLDAKLGMVFYFKNKPCFLVSFFIDENLDVYIQQIQGFIKGRGHYVLGNNWQRTVVNFIKETFSFSKNVYIIDPTSIQHYLKIIYSDSYCSSLDSIFKTAMSQYNQFITNKDVKIIKTSLKIDTMKFKPIDFIYHKY